MTEGQAAGPVRAKNRRQCGGTLACRGAATGGRAPACKGARLVEEPRTRKGTEEMTKTSIGVQELRTRIGEKAKAEPQHRFWGLYTHVWKLDVTY